MLIYKFFIGKSYRKIYDFWENISKLKYDFGEFLRADRTLGFARRAWIGVLVGCESGFSRFKQTGPLFQIQAYLRPTCPDIKNISKKVRTFSCLVLVSGFPCFLRLFLGSYPIVPFFLTGLPLFFRVLTLPYPVMGDVHGICPRCVLGFVPEIFTYDFWVIFDILWEIMQYIFFNQKFQLEI